MIFIQINKKTKCKRSDTGVGWDNEEMLFHINHGLFMFLMLHNLMQGNN